MAEKNLVIDTSGFFASAARLQSLAGDGSTLSTPDLVVFEFAKVVAEEISRAKGSGNDRRTKLMLGLQQRFPKLLRELEVEVWSSGFSIDDVDRLYVEISKGHEPGDAMIWLRMQSKGFDTIATADPKDWNALGAKVVPLA